MNIQKLIKYPLEHRQKRRLLSSKKVSIDSTSKVCWWSQIDMAQGGQIQIGGGSYIDARLITETNKGTIVVGNNCYIGPSTLISASRIDIGNDVIISWGCYINDHNSHSTVWEERKNDVRDWRLGEKNWSYVKTQDIVIEDKVWVGFNSLIMKGVRIGQGAIIAAGSVVVKDIPEWVVVGGNPARIIREIPLDER